MQAGACRISIKYSSEFQVQLHYHFSSILGENLKINYLSPYLETSGSNFTHGVNFAVAGAATQMTGVPFSLYTQVLQFLHFKNRTRELRSKGLDSLISEKEFHNAVYSFDMGQNDISIAFTANLSYPQVLDNIPSILSRIKDSIGLVYENGGRKFWIYNTGPLGCLPQTLAQRKKNDSELDPLGCLADYNNAAKAFNEQMNKLCNKLNSEYKNATIVCTDMYSIKYDLFANHKEYGMTENSSMKKKLLRVILRLCCPNRLRGARLEHQLETPAAFRDARTDSATIAAHIFVRAQRWSLLNNFIYESD